MLIYNLNKIFSIIDHKEKIKIFFLFILILLISILEILGIGLILPLLYFLIDEKNILKFKEILFFSQFSNQQILNLLLTISIIFLTKFILTIFFQIKQNKIIFELMHTLLKKVYSKYLNQSYTFFIKKNSSYFISNLLTQIPDIIYNFIMPSILLCLRDININLYYNFFINSGLQNYFTYLYYWDCKFCFFKASK